MTPDVVNKLEDAFLMGCTDMEACLFAGISKQTLYNYQDKTPGYVDRKEMLKTNPVLQAKRIQRKDLAEDNSSIAQKVLERREGSKVAISGDLRVTEVRREIVHPVNTDS